MRRSKSSTPPERGQGGGDKTTEIAAVRLLARREHSTKDLKRKLTGKGHAGDVVERVVDKLADKKLVSDERFAANYVTYHGRRGHGPIRIRADLRQQGAPEEAIEAALAAAEFQWEEIAAAVRRRKFGDGPPGSLAERAKQVRFLQYRGFSGEQIRIALQGSDDSREAGEEISASDWVD